MKILLSSIGVQSGTDLQLALYYLKSYLLKPGNAVRPLPEDVRPGFSRRRIRPGDRGEDNQASPRSCRFLLLCLERRKDPWASAGRSRKPILGKSGIGRGVVDHATDIYSLGVTLYELLTLQPAFNGRDHQNSCTNRPRRANRAARINSAIPGDLETIVLKAIAKDPSSRYATAFDLAADLNRFLNDQPIVARRPGPVERGPLIGTAAPRTCGDNGRDTGNRSHDQHRLRSRHRRKNRDCQQQPRRGNPQAACLYY